jgi:hypothetical protein
MQLEEAVDDYLRDGLAPIDIAAVTPECCAVQESRKMRRGNASKECIISFRLVYSQVSFCAASDSVRKYYLIAVARP